MLLHPLATSADHGGPRTSDLSIERRIRNHFTTAPLLNITSKAKVHLMHSSKLKRNLLISESVTNEKFNYINKF